MGIGKSVIWQMHQLPIQYNNTKHILATCAGCSQSWARSFQLFRGAQPALGSFSRHDFPGLPSWNPSRRYVSQLQMQIKSLEIDINNKDDPEKQKRLLILRTEYNKLTSDKAAKSLLWLNQAFYDQGEKARKLLVWRIKKIQSERASQSREILNDP